VVAAKVFEFKINCTITMTTLVELKLNPVESDFSKLRICVNHQMVDYSILNDTISISCDIDMGIHQLTLQLVDGTRISIIDALVNTASVRHTLYMSYVKTSSDEISQPATVLWNQSQTWVLPFGNPISFWLGLISNKIQSSDFGKNLYEIYNIIYPETIELDTKYPKVIQDFFKYNFDFFCRPKADINFLPQRKCNIDISTYDTQEVLTEVADNQLWIQEHQKLSAQKYYNDQEWHKDYTLWTTLKIYDAYKCILPIDRLPKLQSLIKNLPVNEISQAYLGILPPGSVIAPHTDKKANHVPGTLGCNVLYIPLSWPARNYFKFASGGIVDSNSTWFINNTDHVHALVNDSNQSRVVLTITLDPAQHYQLLS
jgi:hypothetical protein